MLKENIVEKGREIGFLDIKFTGSEPFTEYLMHLQTLKEKNIYPPFVTEEISLRTNPRLILASCKTIIAVAMSYKHLMDIAANNPLPENYGYISPSAWHTDYHTLLKDSMEELIEFIDEQTEGKYTFKAYVDTGHLSDREIAKRAGLGYIGKNSCLITAKSGSYVWLGHILTNLYIKPDTQMNRQCGDCRNCILACPTKAINDDGTIDYNKCLSNVLVQKGDLPKNIINKMGKRIYGCDTCQMVCPKNNVLKSQGIDEYIEPGWMDLEELDKHSNKTFKEKYGHTAFSWRGKSVLKRNADAIKDKETQSKGT